MPASIDPSPHLGDVRYEIRGALTRRARELESAGSAVVKLHIGNPARYGFETPPHLRQAIAAHLADSEGYGHEQGLETAREAIAAQQRARGAQGVAVERIFIGNGVSELIDLSLRALLQPGEEVLLPSPDYPLWSAATILNGGRPRYYRCQAANAHLPDPDELEALLTPRTRAHCWNGWWRPPSGTACCCSPTKSMTKSSTTVRPSSRWPKSPARIRASVSAACPRCTGPAATASAG